MPNQSCRSERSLLCPSSVAQTRERTVRSTVSVGRRVPAAVVAVIRAAALWRGEELGSLGEFANP